MKVALFFDVFEERGGAERVAIILAKHLDADIYTTYVDWNKADKELRNLNVNEIGLFLKNAKIFTFSEIAKRFSRLELKGYDACLFLRLYCLSATYKNHPNIWISCGILRSVHDLHDYFYKKMNLLQKPIFKLWCKIYGSLDQKWVKDVDSILANSKFTADRIKKYYNVNSKVAYHPIETKQFRCKSYDDFYMTASRLVSEKNVDLVVKAFKEMPDKKLIVVGDGPQRKELENLAKGCKNITFTSSLDFSDVIKYYSKCTASLSMCLSEDWGLIPLESMASGKPCIVANAGGYKESIIHGKTGFLIKPEVDEIIKHVKMLTPKKAKSMKRDCIKRAKMFDVEMFIKKIKKEINYLREKDG